MSLLKFSYEEYNGDPRHWVLNEATFADINLIVGKNSTGKSRVLSVISSLASMLNGNRPVGFESGLFKITLRLSSGEFYYVLSFRNGNVVEESLAINGESKLHRAEDGSGKIYYVSEGKFLDFKLPPQAVAALSRRDEIQHPYLIELNDWAKSIALYQFGSDFGKSRLMPVTEASTLFGTESAPTLLDDPDNLVGVYSTAFMHFREAFDAAIISDMKALGYSLTDVGSDNLQRWMNLPMQLVGMFVVEEDLGFPNPQINLSQGMYRALALVIHLNACIFAKKQKLILVDDIGEGLDFERSSATIALLIEKAKTHGLQLIMATNDQFVMNKVPLDYWMVLNRTGCVVDAITPRNSPNVFSDFKYVGLNNFDFFSSKYFDRKAN